MNLRQTIYITDLRSMERLASMVCKIIEKNDVICLNGDLGAGKTTFTQFLAQGLSLEETDYVSSPSFAIMHEYKCNIPLYHMDFYRLSSEDEIIDLGLEEYLYNDGISVIEWSSRLGDSLPENRLELNISIEGEDQRLIEIVGVGPRWKERAASLYLKYKES